MAVALDLDKKAFCLNARYTNISVRVFKLQGGASMPTFVGRSVGWSVRLWKKISKLRFGDYIAVT